MSLLDDARALAQSVVEDTSAFASEVTCTDELAVSATLAGFVNEIALAVDPDTGVQVSLKQASVVLSRASIAESGLAYPKAIPDTTGAPWRVAWAGADGVTRTCKVIEVVPDENPGIDLVTLKLDAYEP